MKRRLGITDFDLDIAAHESNHVCKHYYGRGSKTPDALALGVRWKRGPHYSGTLKPGWVWLNPEFDDIMPWVERAEKESRRYDCRIAVLVPLSIAKWWTEYVDGTAVVFLLHGRLTFVGQTKPYPKDCALLLYGSGMAPGYYVWDWKK